ncbi:unnamed protein product [Polarella glacialis]|uniref:Myeloid leukemia factor 1 n=1 Tax=Polarella glacialis TaxID=89957 RepID=A0A813G3L4_POLGL|nr:unnamed protein product [Polarella glacialis]
MDTSVSAAAARTVPAVGTAASPAAPATSTAPAATVPAAAELDVAPLTARFFHGHDPFAEFSPDPFSAGGTHRAFGSGFGSGFGRVMQGLENLSEELLGVRPTFPHRVTLPGAAHFSVQTATMSSFADENGQTNTEQFASSDVGHRGHNIRETHQAYSNSATGVNKCALEQHLGHQAVKKVKKRDKDAREETSEIVLGMEDTVESKGSFKKDFEAKAQHLPEHQTFSGDFPGFSGLPGGLRMPPLPGAGGWRQPRALETGKGGA